MLKCNHCKSKIGSVIFNCKCEKQFCSRCRLPESHNCLFDYKLEEKRKVSLVKVAGQKIVKI